MLPIPKSIPVTVVTLLNAMVPVTTLFPPVANTTSPVPPVNVDVPLATVEPPAIVITPPEVITIDPPLVKLLFTVSVPAAPKVNPPVPVSVTVLGALATVAFTVKALFIVTVELAAGIGLSIGKLPPSHVVAVFQSPDAWVM